MSYMVMTCQWCGQVYDIGVVGTTIIGSGHTCTVVKTCAAPGCEERGKFLVCDEATYPDDPVLVFTCGTHIEDRIIAACQPGVETLPSSEATLTKLAADPNLTVELSPEEIAQAEHIQAKADTEQDRGLTPEQAYFVRSCVGRWLRIREQFERENGAIEKVAVDDWPGYAIVKKGERRFKDGELSQMAADAEHSALLVYLLTGGEPLPEPPPCVNAYPMYPKAS